MGIFFGEKGKGDGDFPPIFLWEKKAAGQILTGLVELVADIDFVRFHLDVFLIGWRVHPTRSSVSWVLPLVLLGAPFKKFLLQERKFFKRDWA